MDVLILHKTISGMNAREHHQTRARRVKKEREATAWMLKGKPRPPLPVNVHLVRTSPSVKGLDDDNLRSALKGVRDQIAEWLRVDDGDKANVSWSYDQRPDKPKRYSIEVTFSHMIHTPLPPPLEPPWTVSPTKTNSAPPASPPATSATPSSNPRSRATASSPSTKRR